MRVAIIGAGVSGLASARYALKFDLNCVVFEARDSIGGTWLYTEEAVPKDDHGVAVHANIFKSLRTNLPTQLMEYSGFKFEPNSELNYPYRDEVLKYIEDFAENFRLYPLIKFQHLVQRVSRKDNGWKITVKNLKNLQVDEEYFDAVMICNGHNAKPFTPYISGLETFEGVQTHSNYYKHNTPYENKRVLVVGQGPSGLDISLECAQVATKVYICCRGEEKPAISHHNIQIKPEILKISSNSVMFTDETTVEIESIIFCTGFELYFPFLDKSCGVEIIKNVVVRPLFKRYINIRYPTMCFIGLLTKTVILPLVDLQAKVFLKLLTDQIDLPPIDLMLKWENEENKKNIEMNVPLSKYHSLGEKMRSYLEDLATFGQTETLSEVHFKIYCKNREIASSNYEILKNQNYKIIDNETFLWELK